MSDIDIKQLRASIDGVDNKIIALLNERCGYVKQVGMTKKARQAAGKSFIRSGREADMIRHMFNTFSKEGAFPAQAAAHLWRIVIAASLSLENSLNVSAYWAETKQDVYWLSREYFGNFTPTIKQTTTRRVVADIMDDKAEVGAVPMPDASPEGSWWLKLPDDIKIFACVPFIMTGDDAPPVLLIARVDPEPTGDDVTLISIETEADVSQSRLKAVFEKHKVQVTWLSAESFPSGNRMHLVEMKGFFTLADEVVQAISADIGSPLKSLRHLGSYAVPIRY